MQTGPDGVFGRRILPGTAPETRPKPLGSAGRRVERGRAWEVDDPHPARIKQRETSKAG